MVSLRRNFRLKDFLILNLVDLSGKEKEMVRSWRNCDDIRGYMCQNHLISRLEHAAFIRQLKKNERNFYWIVKSMRGDYLGTISLGDLDRANRSAYIGIYVNPYSSLTGKGSVLMECLKYLSFSRASLHTLNLEVLEDNDRAMRFYKKCGFLVRGRLKEMILRKGAWKDIIIMSIINSK